jgi:hypothetical protein
MLDLYCLRNGLNPMLVAFVSGLLLKGKHIYLAAFVSEFITVYLNNFFFFLHIHMFSELNHPTDTPRLTAVIVLLKARRQLQRVYIWSLVYVSVYKGVRSKPGLHHTGT